MLSENFRYRYKLSIFDWHGKIDVIIKQLTGEQVVILGSVQRLSELRDDLTYDDLSRLDISKFLFELCCKQLLFFWYCIVFFVLYDYVTLIYHF